LNFVGGDQPHLERYVPLLRRRFESKDCKGILCWTPSTRDLFARFFPWETVLAKTTVVPLAVAAKRFEKSPRNEQITLLFVNSANIVGQFDIKGGKEVIEAFIRLRRRYPGLRLTIRSDMAPEYKRRYARIENMQIIDNVVPEAQLAQIFMDADIFVMPTYTGVGASILEAMSYELPVIARPIFHIRDVVEDGKTGILLRRATGLDLPALDSGMELDPTHSAFRRAIRSVAYGVVDELEEKLSMLIEDHGLRREMGRAGRAEIESGKFSIDRRNGLLRRVLDEALR
jgi:glycosyltransferase involved in cell wall biosynthesis